MREEGSHTLLGNTKGHRGLYQNCIPEVPPPNAAWLSRLVYFGNDFCGDAYAWDTQDVTHKRHSEYRTYRLRRMQERDPEDRGGTLAELIQGVWNEKLRLMEEDEQELPTGIDFQTWGALREKVTPDKADVRLWLAFNNNTARDLALAIRHQGATDTFPILDDALQEAGCSNADLLNSCRTGDPAFDGKWVLRVLGITFGRG